MTCREAVKITGKVVWQDGQRMAGMVAVFLRREWAIFSTHG